MMQGFVVSGCGESQFNGTYWPDPGAKQHDDSWSRPYKQLRGEGTLEFFADFGGNWFLTERYGGITRKYYVCQSTSSTPPLSGWEVWRGAGAGKPAVAAPPPSLLPTG